MLQALLPSANAPQQNTAQTCRTINAPTAVGFEILLTPNAKSRYNGSPCKPDVSSCYFSTEELHPRRSAGEGAGISPSGKGQGLFPFGK